MTREERRLNLLEFYAQAVDEGVHVMTISRDDLARRAGVSKSLVSWIFPSRDTMIEDFAQYAVEHDCARALAQLVTAGRVAPCASTNTALQEFMK